MPNEKGMESRRARHVETEQEERPQRGVTSWLILNGPVLTFLPWMRTALSVTTTMTDAGVDIRITTTSTVSPVTTATTAHDNILVLECNWIIKIKLSSTCGLMLTRRCLLYRPFTCSRLRPQSTYTMSRPPGFPPLLTAAV